MNREYKSEQWEIERKATLLSGPFLLCPYPRCGRAAYGAYTSPSVEKYCMCKFCGFWQEVGGEPKQCPIFHHDCKGNKQPLPLTGHPRKGDCYTSNEKAEEVSCEFCDEVITEKAKWPIDDPENHPLLKP